MELAEHGGFAAADESDGDAFASMIDHTILKAEATAAEVRRYCREARLWRFRSVCVNTDRVEAARLALDGSDVRVCAVVGFPLGAMGGFAKAEETRFAVNDGATEIDMVMALGRLRDGDHAGVAADIARLRRGGTAVIVLKLIIEACLLTGEEKRVACRLGVAEGVDYVKTSTGFSTGGATIGDVALMRATVRAGIGVKASGGIRTRDAALAMIEAGATRIGPSSGVGRVGAGGIRWRVG